MTDARDQNGLRTIHVVSHQLLGLRYPPSGGRSTRPTARRHCLPAREFLMLNENPIMRSTLTLVRRFPNPIPAGTSLQRWALLDVTVRC